jgi:hypothetical protein
VGCPGSNAAVIVLSPLTLLWRFAVYVAPADLRCAFAFQIDRDFVVITFQHFQEAF